MSGLDVSQWGGVTVTPTDQGNRRVQLTPSGPEDLGPMVAAVDGWLAQVGRTRSPIFRADSNPWFIMHRHPIQIPQDD